MAVLKPTLMTTLQAGTKETPTKLSITEMCLAGLLMLAGTVVTVVVLAIFLTDGQWLTEQTTATGEGASKAVETKKYSDALPLAAIGVGGLLVLSGAFFGRLREVTLPGGAGFKLADLKKELEERVEQAAHEKATRGEVEPEKVGVLQQEAKKEASLLILEEAGAAPEDLDQLVQQAIEKARTNL